MASPNSRATRPLASLTRLSPSRMSTTRCGKPTRLAIDVAAIASVVDTTAPSTNPNCQVKPGMTQRAVRAMPMTVATTRPIASMEMLTRLKRNSRHEVSHAAEYNNGGRTTRKMKSGFSVTLGTRGKKLSSNPASTSTMGYGRCSLRAIAAKTATNVSSDRKTNSVACIPPPVHTVPVAIKDIVIGDRLQQLAPSVGSALEARG